MILVRLYFEFFKVGLFAVGGGLATLPFLYSLGARTGWFTAAEVADMLAVSESTPGPIGVNMATYVGYRCGGVPGGVVATLGLVTPCFLVILLVGMFLNRFRSSRYVDAAFYGLRPASTGLIAAAGWSVAVLVFANRTGFASTGDLLELFRWKHLLLFAVLFVMTNYIPKIKNAHPSLFILLAALAGIAFRLGGA